MRVVGVTLLLAAVVATVLLTVPSAHAATVPESGVKVLPMPASLDDLGYLMPLDPHTFVFDTDCTSAILRDAFVRYQNKTFTPYVHNLIVYESVQRRRSVDGVETDGVWGANGEFVDVYAVRDDGSDEFVDDAAPLESLVVTVLDNGAAPLELHVDESYTLTVDGGVGNLTAPTVWGALHGLETFSQLVSYDHETDDYYVAAVDIRDAPRFPWRGMLIDTSRHYIPIDLLLRNIDALAYNKYNVFHWHITDAQSFPYASEKFPDLIKGAYYDDAVYTLKEIKFIIDYAHARGVRVVPEFDMPAHTYSWGEGHPELRTTCPNWFATHADIAYIPFNPAYSDLYEFIDSFLEEATGVFGDAYLHIGGDELFPFQHGRNLSSFVQPCWEENQEVKTYMENHGITTHIGLFGHFMEQVHALVNKNKRKMMLWQEPYDYIRSYLHRDTIIQAWISSELHDIVKDGFQALFSNGFYLDQQTPGQPSHYLWEDTWQNFFWNEPMPDPSKWTEEEMARVLGGEAAMWGEQVDEANWMARVWPRAMATAERLWSTRDVTNVPAAAARITAHHCRMKVRGLRVGPLQPDFCQSLATWEPVPPPSACPAPLTMCNAECVNTAVDTANCNACGHACAAGYACAGAQGCVLRCPAGLHKCAADACVDVRTSAQFCGSCEASAACAAGSACVDGECKEVGKRSSSSTELDAGIAMIVVAVLLMCVTGVFYYRRVYSTPLGTRLSDF